MSENQEKIHTFPSLNILTDEQITLIKNTAFSILEKAGASIRHEQARKMLAMAGCIVENDNVKVPRQVIEKCLNTAPKGFIIYDRNGNSALELKGKNFYYGTSTASPKTMDAYTGEVRPTSVNDIAFGAKLGDGLTNIDFIMPMGSAQDVPGEAADLFEFEAAVTNSTKPMVFISLTPEGTEIIYEMASMIVGGKENLRAKPFLISYPEPITPLVYPEKVIEKMFICADWGLPQLAGPTVQPGATGPVTLAGSIAQLLAEGFMSTVIVQLRSPGAPCFIAGNVNIFDMRSALMSVAAPEMSLAIAAHAEVARSVGLPTWGMAGCSDAKALDGQAGAESAFALLAQGLGGLNLIHDIGYLDMAMVCSPSMLVLGDEIVGMAKRFLAGFDISPEALALDVIQKTVPGGSYIESPHTLKNFRTELWRPSIFTREHYVTWEKQGKLDLNQRIQAKIKKIMQTHQVKPLDKEILDKMRALRDEGVQKICKK